LVFPELQLAIKPFEYFDYHRTNIGFHGTTVESANRLVAGESFRTSDSDDDWLGKGIYFWEYAPKQAWWWARSYKKLGEPAVVGSIIWSGNCFDLLDPWNLKTLREFHGSLVDRWTEENIEIPTNARHHRNLDCAVFNFMYNEAEGVGTPIDSASGVYVPTAKAKRVWKGSWIYDDAHIQICVRNPKSILAVWHVRPDGRYGKQPARKKRRGYGSYGKIVTHLQSMSSSEFRQALLSAGIITKAGNLRAKYKRMAKS